MVTKYLSNLEQLKSNRFFNKTVWKGNNLKNIHQHNNPLVYFLHDKETRKNKKSSAPYQTNPTSNQLKDQT